MRPVRKPKLYSIDRILWSSFTLFAILLLLFVMFFEMQNIRRSLRNQVFSNLNSVTTETYRYLGASELTAEELDGYLLSVSTAQGMRVCLLEADGTVLFPTIPASGEADRDYAALIAAEREKFSYIEGLNRRGVTETNRDAVFFLGELGDEHYLYVESSLYFVNSSLRIAQIQSIFLCGVAVIAAFLLSGMIAMRLSKPFTEVTSKAKELEQGNFGVDFAGKYYYSEMEELANGLNSMKDALSRTDQMQKELIANVSHDMKTPLTMIKAYASMIREISGEDKEKRDRHAQVIIDEADRLTTLVNDILNLSKIRAGMDTLKPSVFDLSEYARAVVGQFEYLSETQGYHFAIDIEDGIFVEADKDKIGQVLYNLIGNALNYTGEDKTVRVSLRRGEAVRFAVTDTGSGIPPEELDAIWDRYYRSSETHKRPIKGMGLGLSIVKTICEKHRLDFGVTSEIGAGSTFYVCFSEFEKQQ